MHLTPHRVLEGWGIAGAAYVDSLCLLKETSLQSKTAKAGTSAARAAIVFAPKDLRLARSADRALAEGMAQPSRAVAESSNRRSSNLGSDTG